MQSRWRYTFNVNLRVTCAIRFRQLSAAEQFFLLWASHRYQFYSASCSNMLQNAPYISDSVPTSFLYLKKGSDLICPPVLGAEYAGPAVERLEQAAHVHWSLGASRLRLIMVLTILNIYKKLGVCGIRPFV
jgi:hypothetical protein